MKFAPSRFPHFLFALAVFGSALLAASTSNIANANENFLACAPGVRPLKEVMKDMSTTSRALASQVNDPSKNAESMTLVTHLEELTIESLNLCVSKLEAGSDAAARHSEYLGYQKMISQLFAVETDLELALLKNDNAAAVAAFAQVKDFQRTGHARFK